MATTKPQREAKKVAIRKARVKAAKEKFDSAHVNGMAALKSGDYEALGEAIKREREAIESLPRMRTTKRPK